MNETDIKTFIGDHGWLVAVGLVGLIFRSTLQKIAASLFVFWGDDYQSDDIVYIDRRPARIVRKGMWKTTFYIYEVDDGQVVGGKKLVIQNEMLASLHIEKPLKLINMRTKP